MVKLNKGKKKTSYIVSLMYRGHKNKKDLDIIVKFKGRIVERLGYIRAHLDYYVHFLKKDKFLYWVTSTNIIYSKGFEKLLLKILNAFI